MTNDAVSTGITNNMYTGVRADKLIVSARIKFTDSFTKELLECKDKLNTEQAEFRYSIGDKGFLVVNPGTYRKEFGESFDVVFVDRGVVIGLNIQKSTRSIITVCMVIGSTALLFRDGGSIWREFIKLLEDNALCYKTTEEEYLISRVDICRDVYVPFNYYYDAYINKRYVSKLRSSKNIHKTNEMEEADNNVRVELSSNGIEGNSIYFGNEGYIYERIYDKKYELKRNQEKEAYYYSKYPRMEDITRFEVMYRRKALLTFKGSKQISTLLDFDNNMNMLFKHAFTVMLRIPLIKYGKTNKKENTKEWDLVVEGIPDSGTPLTRRPKRLEVHDNDKPSLVYSGLVGRLVSITAQSFIQDTMILDPDSMAERYSTHVKNVMGLDKYYESCSSWLKKKHSVHGTCSPILEHEIVARYRNNDGIVSSFIDIDKETIKFLARKVYKPEIHIGICNINIEHPNHSSNKKRVVFLESFGKSLLYYDPSTQKILSKMTLRAAWMSYLLTNDMEDEYLWEFCNRKVKLSDIKQSVVDHMLFIYHDCKDRRLESKNEIKVEYEFRIGEDGKLYNL